MAASDPFNADAESAAFTASDSLRKITLQRLDNFVSSTDRIWNGVNLSSHSQALYPETRDHTSLEVWTPDFPDEGRHRFQSERAIKGDAPYTTTIVGTRFGPSWSTHWFRVRFNIPESWGGKDVHLRWNSGGEAMVWSPDAVPLCGLTGDDLYPRNARAAYVIPNPQPGVVTFFIETAVNKLDGPEGDITPPPPDLEYELKLCEISLFNPEAWALLWDIDVIKDTARELDAPVPVDGPYRGQKEQHNNADKALRVGNSILNHVKVARPQTFAKGREIAQDFLSRTAGELTHEILACGHCHIDTAWLWPVDETRRKTARSWVSQLRNMELYPHMHFTASQAVQWKWLQQDYPGLFDEIKAAVARGQFHPNGGTWVEMDGNMPSGESFARQFLFGQRFFKEHFGAKSDIFWLPDTFGYGAQIPQICRQAGIKYFMTQKISWNNVTSFPHSSFVWRGIDGSEVFAHFPPADTFNGECTVDEIMHSERNNKSKSASNESLYLYGIGDGGGGPQRRHIERLDRMANVAGLPNVRHAPPSAVFEQLEARHTSSPRKLATHIGELYLEYHRGVLTNQGVIKKGNRFGELWLQLLELLSVLGMQQRAFAYPQTEINRLWDLLLTNQFHDILPGTAIEEAMVQAREWYADILQSARRLLGEATNALFQGEPSNWPIPEEYKAPDDPPQQQQPANGGKRALSTAEWIGLDAFFPTAKKGTGGNQRDAVIVVNATSWERREVVTLPDDSLALVSAPPHGYRVHSAAPAASDDDDSIRRIRPEERCVVSSLAEDFVLLGDALEDSDDDLDFEVVGGAFRGVERLRSPPLATSKLPPPSIGQSPASPVVQCTLENSLIRAEFAASGKLVRLYDRENDREVITPGSFGNALRIYDDQPIRYDAWDLEQYHLQTGELIPDAISCAVIEDGELRSVVRFEYTISSKSTLTQTISLSALSRVLEFDVHVDWNESHRNLKAEFDVDIASDIASYEVAYGIVERPTHFNFEKDIAKFEVCGHRFADLSEHGYGVALFSDCRYGYSCRENRLRLSLLKASKNPDPQSDMGKQSFRYAFMPHAGTLQDAGVVQAAHSFNQRLMVVPTLSTPHEEYSFVSTDRDGVVVDTVKKAEDSPSHVVVRLYEAFGAHTTTTVTLPDEVEAVVRCNFIEEVEDSPQATLPLVGNTVKLALRPFEVVSLLLTFGATGADSQLS